VVFGDVSLSKNQVRSIAGHDQSPGAGGWPTIRYFNKETGYGGKPYPKKTDMAMCDELGPKGDAEGYMQAYVEEYGGTSLCNVRKTEKGCSEKQKSFIEKWSSKPEAELKKQLDRVKGMVGKDGGSMKPDALAWAKQRLSIFKQLTQPRAEL